MIDKTSEEYIKAKIAAVKYIVYKKRTVDEVRNKLKMLQVNTEIIEDVIENLIEEEYLNDEIYIQKYIKENNKLSVSVLKIKLKTKGIDEELINKYLCNDDIDETENIKLMLKKKKFDKSMDIDEQNKIKLYCLRKGFKLNDIEKAIKDFEY